MDNFVIIALAYWCIVIIGGLWYYYHNKSTPQVQMKYAIRIIVLLPFIIPVMIIIAPFVKLYDALSVIECNNKKRNVGKLYRTWKKHKSLANPISEDDVIVSKLFLESVSETSYFRTGDIKKMSTPDLLRYKEKLEREIETGVFIDRESEDLLTPLSAITIEDGYELDYYGPTENGIGGQCHFVACPSNSSCSHNAIDGDKNIFKYFSIEKSAKGAWQAFVLYTAWHSMPLYWHAYYDEWIRIYSNDDWEAKRLNLIDNGKNKNNRFINWKRLENIGTIKIKNLTPKVYFHNNEAFISCYIWNSFSGIKHYVYHIDFSVHPVQFTEVEESTVISCGNGILL